MYWPVKVLDVLSDGLKVQYDNGEVETVSPDNVHPFSPPVQFGEERIPLLVRTNCSYIPSISCGALPGRCSAQLRFV
jgi:hypothetical protein